MQSREQMRSPQEEDLLYELTNVAPDLAGRHLKACGGDRSIALQTLSMRSSNESYTSLFDAYQSADAETEIRIFETLAEMFDNRYAASVGAPVKPLTWVALPKSLG